MVVVQCGIFFLNNSIIQYKISVCDNDNVVKSSANNKGPLALLELMQEADLKQTDIEPNSVC